MMTSQANPVDDLHEMVNRYTVRGSCQCAYCSEVLHPVLTDEVGHTIHNGFFRVSLVDGVEKGALRDEFEAACKALNFLPFHGSRLEISFIELGAQLGSQEFALSVMSLGGLLGTWYVRNPYTIPEFEDLMDHQRKELAAMGMSHITRNPEVAIKNQPYHERQKELS